MIRVSIHPNITEEDTFSRRYENLRESASLNVPNSMERDIFMKCGMASWIQAWSSYAPLKNTEFKYKGNFDMSEPMKSTRVNILPVILHSQIAGIIASMAWNVSRS
ncbi:MAG: hypothetical protein A2161_13955 [Candidatus Schekmanbacteria bacterium RBG_13_48_7]|uniref:Uncharacterized protein n=1 Tax=Candidatus Schekmanbacteria bacterium RBG_13_48_7 TaxID=1817878 RepID=A0A1F7RWY2_9BACT|nr:MAG: hypothetical protein A2161_13955 [Candidatus Schekmanbacteria bacterium RBG_13_48_7]